MDPSVTKLAMGIDFSTLALHVTYGGGEEPYRLRLPLDAHDPEDRATEAAKWLQRLLGKLEEEYPSLELAIMTIEKPFMGVNARTLITLTQVQAACLVTCQLQNWFAVQEDPNIIRKKILGKGSSKVKGEIKKMAQQWVRDSYHLELDPDASDSVVIWEYAKFLAQIPDLKPIPC